LRRILIPKPRARRKLMAIADVMMRLQLKKLTVDCRNSRANPGPYPGIGAETECCVKVDVKTMRRRGAFVFTVDQV
jgi:hypothetical protein